MKAWQFVLVLFLVGGVVAGQSPDLSVGTRFGGPAPETVEIIAAYQLTGEGTKVAMMQPVMVYVAIGGALREGDFGLLTVGGKVFPYPDEIRALFFYAGATLAWSGGYDFPDHPVVRFNDELVLGPEVGVGLSPFDPESGSFLGGYVLPEFSLGYSSVTGRIVSAFTIGMYW